MRHSFFIVDVFTGSRFGGNQLAVFPEADGFPDDLMQAYAREFNFSETTFVLPPRKPGHTHRVRIFTPARELPFAGHPNIGTAVVLAALEKARSGQESASFVFEEDVGAVRVAADIRPDGGFAELTLEQSPEIRPSDVSSTALAAMLSIPQDWIGPRRPWSAGIGVRFFCLPLIDREAVAAARLDLSKWEEALPADSWTRWVYAIAGDFAPGGRLKVRMWAPGDGVLEDPATGSAAGALAASLAAALPDPDGVFRWTIEQGAEIGRPSVIQASAEKRGGAVVAIRVGGQAVIVAEGSFI
jgi:trans-2,3-dihydro-3-hydroxyanthranilate isomerase